MKKLIKYVTYMYIYHTQIINYKNTLSSMPSWYVLSIQDIHVLTLSYITLHWNMHNSCHSLIYYHICIPKMEIANIPALYTHYKSLNTSHIVLMKSSEHATQHNVPN